MTAATGLLMHPHYGAQAFPLCARCLAVSYEFGSLKGPPRGRNKPTGVSKSLKAAKHLEHTLTDLERSLVEKRKPVPKEPFPGRSSGSLAASAAEREPMPGTVTGDLGRDLHHLENLVDHASKVLKLDEGETVDEDDLESQPITSFKPDDEEDDEGAPAKIQKTNPTAQPVRTWLIAVLHVCPHLPLLRGCSPVFSTSQHLQNENPYPRAPWPSSLAHTEVR
ncbi:uncharacterized protein LOC117011282 [Catharus ustulatus]|uniref:uncharacterized protein LOC117011282 n=1 Tax=Catharus ustulatus TaxID=91951 RepID=UPI0014094E2A|nr:uncharacterized protein LOC117011282 [Catharus ustulatus]